MAKVEFYDVKDRKKIMAEVVGKVEFANGRFGLKGRTADGRNLTRFVSKAEYDKH